MERRELLKLVAMATGAALAVPLSSAVLTACAQVEKVEEKDYDLQFFSADDFKLVKELLDVILPETDSPSAVTVGVHQVMDHMLAVVYGLEDKNRFSEGFAALKDYLTDDVLEGQLRDLLANKKKDSDAARLALIGFKQRAVAYYLSNKDIATTYLNFLPIPGKYESCISLESVGGKAWAI